MSVFKVIVDIFQNYVFNQPFIFLSIVAMIGLILQKKSIDKIISGSVKTGIGYYCNYYGYWFFYKSNFS